MKPPPVPPPAPWPASRPRITDLQYVVFHCRLPIAAAAHHTGMTTGKVRAELARSGPPPGFSEDDLVRFLQQ